MAALKLLLSQARRHSLSRSSSLLLRPPPSLQLSKSLSSVPESDEPDDPRRPQPVPIQSVSYPAKPKQEEPASSEASPPQDAQPPAQSQMPLEESPGFRSRSPWSQEDLRYMKDAGPRIAPVSYPTRVAPLPEDKASREQKDEEMQDERRWIEEDRRAAGMRRRMSSRMFVEEGEDAPPFPTLLKVTKNESKPVYDLAEAIRLVKTNAKANFDETVEAHVRLGIERKRSDLIVRGSMVLPHGEGMKVSKIAFLGEGTDAEEARAAGADIVGGIELVEEIANSGGKFDVQKCFTTPDFMRHVLKIAKILKPLGLLPNAKQGTLVTDVSQAVRDAKRSNIDFKMDKTSNVHVGLGKVSLPEESLRENIGAFVNALLRAKPAGLKKTSKYAGYVNAFHICSTMGPGYSVSIQSLSKAADHHSKVHLS
ncbi:uncharacterized protein LOC116195709 [Punica granatum]|uniref:CL1 n=2 Tax=Punica granatum TaxID=22663 RepID=A0A218X243_PUNGR|nr:uncharacterized protein LOC116195709 [Punica granatum]OWM78720.1 hypothetical protein CDL15_Pgr002891 [Punica granatum]PKI44002.1 hypothetical protein CRG98_035587 [Punica granatum]